MKANDPVALCQMGHKCYNEGDYKSAFKYYTKAAELEDLTAYCQLGIMYGNGQGAEKDEVKAVYYFEKAAIGGHPYARNNLALYEQRHGSIERSVKHLIIAANLGYPR